MISTLRLKHLTRSIANCPSLRLLALVLFVISASADRLAASDDSAESQVGNKVTSFELSDYQGNAVSLDSYEESKIVVLLFLGTECPLVQLYGPQLERLSETYQDQDVAFIGINPNSQDSISEIAAYAKQHEISFPILKDVGNKIADRIGATRTPEVFVLDADRVIRYQGRIDDQYAVGVVRDDARSENLIDALDELLEGKPVGVSYEPAIGCLIGRIREPVAESEVTYANQISRILQKRCLECHRTGEIGPFALDDYDEVAGWADMIAEVVEDQRMPPWHAEPGHVSYRNDRSLTDEEKQLIYRWVENGAPEGDPSELPEPVKFVADWQLSSAPDLDLDITEEPFVVKAEGFLDYRYFELDYEFEEDKWMVAAEMLPGNRRVVHHMLAFARAPGEDLRGAEGGARGFLSAYVPGLRAEPYPDGMAKFIPAGSKIIVQMHYTPIGREQTDQSRIGFWFVDADEVTHEVVTTSALKTDFRIQPYKDDQSFTAYSDMDHDNYQLLSMMPHMHLRGKAFQYTLVDADRKSRTILNVPNYDFNWQTSYRLDEPLLLEPGSRVICEATFDNSAENPNNPGPEKRVGWGDQTWDEMLIGYYDVSMPKDKAAALRTERLERSRRRLRQQAKEAMERYDANGDGVVEKDEMPARARRVFDRLDLDGDGKLTLEELIRAYQR